MRRPFTIFCRPARSDFSYRSIRYISSTPPIINIQNGTFYRQFPSLGPASQSHNPPLYPDLNFVLPSVTTSAVENGGEAKLPHWGIIGSSGRTTFLQVLQGQYICSPTNARSYPYLSSDGYTGKHRTPSRAIQYVGFSDEGPQSQGKPRGAYLSARYESRREETDFTLFDYLRGRTSLNPMEGEEEGTLHNTALLDQVVADLRLEKLVNLPVGNLSNGQTRRAKVAKAILENPEVLLIDEPFSTF